MKINFFVENGLFDNNALLGGVFAIEAENAENGKKALLYVGASEAMAVAAAGILKKTVKYPEYLGLSKGMVGSDDLILYIKVLECIRVRKTLSTMGVYRDAEVNWLIELKPLTQHKNNKMLILEKKREELVRKALDM